MIKKIFPLVLMMASFAFNVQAQTITPEEYIETYKDIAIREMKRMGVPAAITLAQGILESESGNSSLVKKSNNHFGIKCKSNWTAETVSHDDDAVGECFRTYKTSEDSYRDHSNFLRAGKHYAFLFNLNPTDYKAWAYGLKKAGYATNPKYPNILIKNIEKYNLQQYSDSGAADVPKFESDKYKDDPIVIEKEDVLEKDQPTAADNNANIGTDPVPDASSVFSVNGSKCINAKKGTSLLAIATRHNINLKKLLDINELEEDGILEEDQLIFLQKKSKNGEKDFVIAGRQATLYDVAQQNGIQLESLLSYNQLEEDGEVKPGTKLYLKPISQSDQAKLIRDNAAAAKVVLYEVKPKEGLYTVAKKNGVTVQQIKEWNNLTSDDLKIGQQLIVSK
jgi:LysM repeat protein